MNARVIFTMAASAMAIAIASSCRRKRVAPYRLARGPGANARHGATRICRGEWTTEGEYGVPLERPAQFGTRQY